MQTSTKKVMHLLAVMMLVITAVVLLFPLADRILNTIRVHSYAYGYSVPKNLVAMDTSALPPAEGVPVLMYHGVIAKGEVETNTSRKTFIAQMEMLKRNGYQTISVKEYDLFREGKFTLPPKPIIVTFDDGRKDSFYTVDEVLRKLGFKATMFIATIKANNNDPFYLSWEELRAVQATGRWELEAHGRHSHDEVLIDEYGTKGRFYASLTYIPGKGLESVEDYKKRVEQDYLYGISDLKEHLSIDAKYFAVPLNSYGVNFNSNYKDAALFNQELTRKYFKFSFVQATQEEGVVFESFYNYQNSDSYFGLKRLEVKDMSAENLLKYLERFAPKKATLSFKENSPMESFLGQIQLLYGKLTTDKGVLTLSSDAEQPSARVLFGDRGWKNYIIKTKVYRDFGRSASVLIYYTDEDDALVLDWGDNFIELRENMDGVERRLAGADIGKTKEMEISLGVDDGFVSAYYNGILLTSGIKTKLPRGGAGFGVWDPKGAQATIKNLEITSLE